MPERPGRAEHGNPLKEWYSNRRNANPIQTYNLISKITMAADEIAIEEEIHVVAGVLRRENRMGLQGWGLKWASCVAHLFVEIPFHLLWKLEGVEETSKTP